MPLKRLRLQAFSTWELAGLKLFYHLTPRGETPVSAKPGNKKGVVPLYWNDAFFFGKIILKATIRLFWQKHAWLLSKD